MERLPSRGGGYALDLDSTRLLHEEGHQEGVKTGYTRLGTKPCLHPLLAVLEEAKLVVGFAHTGLGHTERCSPEDPSSDRVAANPARESSRG
jgi:hypothetical protein